MSVFAQTMSSKPPNVLLLSIVIHHHEPECHAKRLAYYFQGQDHSEGSKLNGIFMYRISSVPLVSWQPNEVC